MQDDEDQPEQQRVPAESASAEIKPTEESAALADSEREELLRLRKEIAESRDLYQDREHETRVDELSEERATHPEPIAPWVRPSSLEAPEPRPGLVQRWIRITVRGEDDPRNVNLRMREGWVPRPMNTISEDFQMLGSEVDKGRLIVDDLMLCEMPEEKYAQRKAYYKKLTRDQMIAVEHDLEDAQVQGHRITKTHTSTVSHPAPRVRGRQVEAAEDS